MLSSKPVVPNLFVSADRSTFDDSTAAHQRGGGDADCFKLLVLEHAFKIKLVAPKNEY